MRSTVGIPRLRAREDVKHARTARPNFSKTCTPRLLHRKRVTSGTSAGDVPWQNADPARSRYQESPSPSRNSQMWRPVLATGFCFRPAMPEARSRVPHTVALRRQRLCIRWRYDDKDRKHDHSPEFYGDLLNDPWRPDFTPCARFKRSRCGFLICGLLFSDNGSTQNSVPVAPMATPCSVTRRGRVELPATAPPVPRNIKSGCFPCCHKCQCSRNRPRWPGRCCRWSIPSWQTARFDGRSSPARAHPYPP
jgi:hypothetical protein